MWSEIWNQNCSKVKLRHIKATLINLSKWNSQLGTIWCLQLCMRSAYFSVQPNFLSVHLFKDFHFKTVLYIPSACGAVINDLERTETRCANWLFRYFIKMPVAPRNIRWSNESSHTPRHIWDTGNRFLGLRLTGTAACLCLSCFRF